MNIEVQEGEGDATVRICSLNRCFPDDVEGQCEQCHKDIFYRPEPPYRCMFICHECGEAHIADEDNECRISPKTLEFLKENRWLFETLDKESLHPHLKRLKAAIKDL